MNRFKKTIATVVTTLMIVMAFAIISVGEAEAKSKAPFDKSTIPPAKTAIVRRSAKISAPYGGIGESAKYMNMEGTFRGIRTSRQFHLLPHIEQN